jgi:hypothetical protein
MGRRSAIPGGVGGGDAEDVEVAGCVRGIVVRSAALAAQVGPRAVGLPRVQHAGSHAAGVSAAPGDVDGAALHHCRDGHVGRGAGVEQGRGLGIIRVVCQVGGGQVGGVGVAGHLILRAGWGLGLEQHQPHRTPAGTRPFSSRSRADWLTDSTCGRRFWQP